MNSNTSRNRNLEKWICPKCCQKARAAKTANLTCGYCNEKMIKLADFDTADMDD